MTNLLTTPLEQSIARGWSRIGSAQKAAFGIVIAVSVLAFGFEMTNLTFHHDDAVYIFVQDSRIGRSLGRFGFGLLHYYTQNAYIMPFLQMAQAIGLMAVYGLVIARVWNLERPLDIALVATLVCVFPYMAQIYQYNFCTVPFALAHLLAAADIRGAKRPDHFVGFFYGGRLTKPNLLQVLESLPNEGTCELMCHPGRHDARSARAHWQYRWQDELDALTDRDVGQWLRSRGIELVPYAALGQR